MNRRQFLQSATAAALAPVFARAAEKRTWTAAIIGHTAHGNFGHNMDLVFNDRPGIEVVAIADPDEKGRAAAQQRSGARRAYADYREMLEKERPQLVGVCPR